ncbi:hypothetical protein LMG24235_08537 [Paraburkholderia sabiae]|nr:hypothetical protein LMG24235_08537 [Paraburkholderia sabiae]
MIQQAIEAELSALLERFENVKTLHGQRAVVRNGYLPEREVLTAAGAIPGRSPRRAAQRELRRPVPAGDHRREARWARGTSRNRRRLSRIEGVLAAVAARSQASFWPCHAAVAVELGRDVVRHDDPPVGWCASSRSDPHQRQVPRRVGASLLRCYGSRLAPEPAQYVEHMVNTLTARIQRGLHGDSTLLDKVPAIPGSRVAARAQLRSSLRAD